MITAPEVVTLQEFHPEVYICLDYLEEMCLESAVVEVKGDRGALPEASVNPNLLVDCTGVVEASEVKHKVQLCVFRNEFAMINVHFSSQIATSCATLQLLNQVLTLSLNLSKAKANQYF